MPVAKVLEHRSTSAGDGSFIRQPAHMDDDRTVVLYHCGGGHGESPRSGNQLQMGERMTVLLDTEPGGGKRRDKKPNKRQRQKTAQSTC